MQVDLDLLHLLFVILFLLFYASILIILIEASRKYYLIQICLYFVVPFILIPILIFFPNATNTIWDYIWFIYISIACFLLHILRYNLTNWREKKRLNIVLVILCSGYFFFVLSITTGVYYDLSTQLKQHFLNPGNVIHGIILIFTMPNPINIKISDNDYNSIRYEIGIFWIIGYSIWSTVVLYDIFCHYKLHLIGLYVGVPFFMIIWTKSDCWLQSFAYSIYFYQLINILPFIKYHLPFYLVNNHQNCQYIHDPICIKYTINFTSFIYGLFILIKDIYDEINSWNGKRKSHSTSIIQYFTALRSRVGDLGHIDKRLSVPRTIIVKEFESLQFNSPLLNNFMTQIEQDQF